MTMIGDGAAAPTIRAARPEDAPGIAKALLEAPQFDGTLSEKGLSNLVERAIAAIGGDQETMLVAELDGAAAGYTHVHWVSALFLPGPEGYVTELFVQRGARGRGCGTALLQAVEAIGVERRAARLFLLNGRQSEAYSGGYYPRRGFVEAVHLAAFRRELSARSPTGPNQRPA
jgi:ribosomal protein S18 acetylase RimI-like enzyme